MEQQNKKKRDYFPLGDKAFISFENVPKCMRSYGDIVVSGMERHVFGNPELAADAMSDLWEMYDAEQMLRNEGNGLNIENDE